MESINEVLGPYAVYLAAAIAIAAFLAQFFPAPAEDGAKWYKILYRILNVAALNNGKAKNKDDA